MLLQAFLAEAMLIMATVIHLGKSGLPTKVIHYYSLFFVDTLLVLCDVYVVII